MPAPSSDSIRSIGNINHFTFKIITARNGYQVATLQKIIDPALPTHIYLEGDGRAWRSTHQPSVDPTPQNLIVVYLMAEDRTANLLYIARPCQFIRSDQCNVTDWTSGRYSEKMISAVQDAVLAYPASNRILIGYSGGAAVALLLLNRIQHVSGIITVAGNLNPEELNAWHQVSPLEQSLPTEDALLASANVPQRHWVGAEDEIVPPALSLQMLAPISYSSVVEQRILPGATHDTGWLEHWAQIIQEPLPTGK